MKYLFSIILSLLIALSPLHSQQGFRKLYHATDDSIYGSYVDLLWDGTKLITYGQLYAPNLPSGAWNGQQYVELDTNGQVLHTDIYFEPNDAVVPILNNNMTLLSNGRVLLASQVYIDTFAVIYMYEAGELINSLQFSFPNRVIFAYCATEHQNAIYITGTYQKMNYDIVSFIVKTDLDLNILWQKSYGSTGIDQLAIGGVLFTDNEQIIFPQLIADTQPNNQSWAKGRFSKLDSMGNELSYWESGIYEEVGVRAGKLIPLGDTAFIYSTHKYYPTPGQQEPGFVIPKLVARDTDFNLIWQRDLTDFEALTNVVWKIVPSHDGNFIALGDWGWYSRMAIHKFAPNGDSIWTFAEIAPTYSLKVSGLAVLPSGSIYAAGTSTELGPDKPILFKITPDGCLDTLHCGPFTNTDLIENIGKVSIYPNPANDQITVQNPFGNLVSLYNAQGNLVSSKNLLWPTDQLMFQTSHLANGVYFVRMQSLRVNLTYKVIICH